MRTGVRIGIDVGSVRVGIATCDPAGLIASPVETVAPTDLDRIAQLVTERNAIEVIVGLPRSLSGREGVSAAAAREYAFSLATRLVPVPVRLVDERLTTVSAERGLRSSGVRGRKRRSVVDQAAAVVILQHALDAERTTGKPPGQTVSVEA